jgi:single-strand DNA-binding protein
MFNGTTVTVRGNVATDVVTRQTDGGTPLASFRLAVTARRWSPVEKKTVDVDTSFYTVTCWRGLAENVRVSLHRGEPVVVTGRLRVRDFVHDNQPRTSADIVADAVGHDLSWGQAGFARVVRTERVDPDQIAADALAGEVALAGVDENPYENDEIDVPDGDGEGEASRRPEEAPVL